MNRTITPDRTLRLNRMPVEYELCMSLGWLSTLRWFAGVAVIVATWIAGTVLGLGIDIVALNITGVLILVYNFGFQRWLSNIQCDLTGISHRARNLARVQIAVDWIAMTSLIHFTGGVESPVILYFFFHTTLAAILLSARDTFLFTGLASLLLTGTALLEFVGILPHEHVDGLLPFDLYTNPAYVGSILFFFISAVFVAAYLATRTTRRLREREGEMAQLGLDLHQANIQLEALYQSAQAVSSTLELQEVLDRLTQSATEVLGVKGCTIRLLHETSTQLCLASTYGLSESYLQKGCLLVDQNPLVRQVLAGEIVAVSDVTIDDRLQFPAEAAAEGIRATLTAPLLGKTGPLGIIRVYCESTHCFTEDDQDFLAATASHGSVAIENAMAFQTMQNLEESKRKFILLVTHEVRSPLAVVRSLLNTVTGGYAGELTELQADMIGRALRRTEFLQTLIDDLLDLAAGKTGLRVASETEPVDLQAVLSGVIERYRVPAAEKHITLVVELSDGASAEPGAVPQIDATTDELDRAITNLISNAIKYTPEGGQVNVTLQRLSGKAQLTVKDSGIGIPEEALSHLFEEFYRAPNAKAQVKQGTGLGLVITKDIVTRYGGTIRVNSTEGHGTTFTVILPTIADPGAGPAPVRTTAAPTKMRA